MIFIAQTFFGLIGIIGILLLSIVIFAILEAFVKWVRRPRFRTKTGLIFPAKKEVVDKVKKKFPGFLCYESTVGADGKPVIVIHRTMTQTELLK